MIYIHNDGEALPAVQGSTLGSGARYEFTGIATTQATSGGGLNVIQWPDDYLWPSSDGVMVGSTSQPTADTTSVRDAADFGEFKLVERFYGNGTSGTEGGSFLNRDSTTRIKIELIFYEYAANIAAISGGTSSGSVQFYCPFIQFFSGDYTGDLAADFSDDKRIAT
jgi:hypothetical protein